MPAFEQPVRLMQEIDKYAKLAGSHIFYLCAQIQNSVAMLTRLWWWRMSDEGLKYNGPRHWSHCKSGWCHFPTRKEI